LIKTSVDKNTLLISLLIYFDVRFCNLLKLNYKLARLISAD